MLPICLMDFHLQHHQSQDSIPCGGSLSHRPPPSLTKITTEDSPIFICLILSQLILISTRPSFIPHPRLIRTLSSPSAAIQPFRRFFPHHTLLPSTGPATGNLAWAQQIVVNLWKPSAPSLASRQSNPSTAAPDLSEPRPTSLLHSTAWLGRGHSGCSIRHLPAPKWDPGFPRAALPAPRCGVWLSCRIDDAVWQDHYGPRGSAAWL